MSIASSANEITRKEFLAFGDLQTLMDNVALPYYKSGAIYASFRDLRGLTTGDVDNEIKRRGIQMVAISSCVAGIKCRYNASDNYRASVIMKANGNYISVCPETLAGLGVPRTACEIVGGSGEDVLEGTARIVDKDGIDITEIMLCGVEKALQICLENHITKAYLQSKSPTCGCGKIYDGSFTNTLKSGNGVFTALLNKHGIDVVEVF